MCAWSCFACKHSMEANSSRRARSHTWLCSPYVRYVYASCEWESVGNIDISPGKGKLKYLVSVEAISLTAPLGFFSFFGSFYTAVDKYTQLPALSLSGTSHSSALLP